MREKRLSYIIIEHEIITNLHLKKRIMKYLERRNMSVGKMWVVEGSYVTVCATLDIQLQ